MRRSSNKLASGFRLTNAARSARPALELLEDRLTPTVVFPPQLGAETPAPGFNGPTLSNTPVHLIFEGSYWQSPTGITEGDVIQNVNNILNSSYLSFATQYGTNGHAFLAGTQPDNSLLLSKGGFAESDLQTVAGNYVQEQFNVPGARGLYLVVTAPGVFDATRPQDTGYHNELGYDAPVSFNPSLRLPEEVPFGHVGVNPGNRQAQIDSFSQTFGHELVESMTDPYIQTQAANLFHPGANFQPSFPTSNDTLDEIADFEPNGGRYTYRLASGTLVQAYWDQKGQQFVVPDGTGQTFTLTPNWVDAKFQILGRPLAKVFQKNFDLTVNGDQLSGKDDVYIVQAVTSGPQAGEVSVALNGETAAFDPNQLASFTLNPLTGDDIVDIESLPAGAPLTVNLGAGHDTVALGQVGGQLDGLAGAVTINGGGANSTLRVNDAATGKVNLHGVNLAETHSVAWSVTGNSLSRTDTVQFHVLGQTFTNWFTSNVAYSGLGQIDLFGGPCPNTYYVQASKLGTPLAVDGSGANNALTFDDSANSDNAGTTYNLTAGQVTRVGTDLHRVSSGLFFVTHFTTTVTYAGLQSLAIYGGLSGNTVTVQGTAGGTGTTVHAGAGSDLVNVLGTGAGGPLTVDGAGGSDLVRVGSAAAFGGDAGREGGKLANVQGAVSVSNNAGTATLVVDDSGDPAASSGVSVASGSLTGLGGAAAITWSGTPTRLYLGGTAGQAGNAVNVDASVSGGLPEIFSGAGNDTFTVLNPSVNNTLTVHGEGGNDTVNVIDPNAANASYAFDGSTLTRTGHNPDGTVSGVFTLLVDGVANVEVNGAVI